MTIRMRGVTSIEESGSRQTIVITELPFQVNPDNLISNIAESVDFGVVAQDNSDALAASGC